jgi:hypothetical protein
MEKPLDPRTIARLRPVYAWTYDRARRALVPAKLKYGITLIALICCSQVLPTEALAVTVEVGRKCSALTDKAFPLLVPGNPAAGRTHGTGQDLREYFNKCVAHGGNMEEQAPKQENQKTPNKGSDRSDQAPKEQK